MAAYPLLFFKGVNRAMTVPFKVHPVMRSTGVGRKLQRTSSDQEPPIAQERVPAAKDIKRRRMDILQRLVRGDGN